MTANKKSSKLKEPVRVRTKKLADGSESYYLDIYVNGKRSYEFLKMYHLPEVNARVREQNRATREAVEAIKSQRIIEITNSKAGIKSKSAWQKLTLADWLEKFYAIQERKGIQRVEKLGSIIKIINQYGKITRIGYIDKKITYHTSRHTFGTMMMTVGADLYTTCKLMGHADVRTTQIYAKIVDSKKIEAVDMVDRMFEREEATD